MALKQGECSLPWNTPSQRDAAPSLQTQAGPPREANSTERMVSATDSFLRKQSLARHLPNLHCAQKENQRSGRWSPLSFRFCKMEGGRNSGHLITKFPSRIKSMHSINNFHFAEEGFCFVLFYDIKNKIHSYLCFLPEPRLPGFKSPLCTSNFVTSGKLLYLSVL